MAEAKVSKDKSFEDNFKKLEKLAQELQENNVSIDELVPRMKEAVQSIKICKKVLKETKVKLTEVTAEFAQVDKTQAE